MQVSQKYLRERAKEQENFSSKVTKTMAVEQDMPQFKVYDLKYYEDELNYYEHFYMGDLQIANLKITKKFVKCQDRLS